MVEGIVAMGPEGFAGVFLQGQAIGQGAVVVAIAGGGGGSIAQVDGIGIGGDFFDGVGLVAGAPVEGDVEPGGEFVRAVPKDGVGRGRCLDGVAGIDEKRKAATVGVVETAHELQLAQRKKQAAAAAIGQNGVGLGFADDGDGEQLRAAGGVDVERKGIEGFEPLDEGRAGVGVGFGGLFGKIVVDEVFPCHKPFTAGGVGLAPGRRSTGHEQQEEREISGSPKNMSDGKGQWGLADGDVSADFDEVARGARGVGDVDAVAEVLGVVGGFVVGTRDAVFAVEGDGVDATRVGDDGVGGVGGVLVVDAAAFVGFVDEGVVGGGGDGDVPGVSGAVEETAVAVLDNGGHEGVADGEVGAGAVELDHFEGGYVGRMGTVTGIVGRVGARRQREEADEPQAGEECFEGLFHGLVFLCQKVLRRV